MGEGEGGIIWENGIETYKLSPVKRIASPGPMHDTKFSRLVHWDDPEGRDGEHIYTMADSCQCMAKPIQYCKVNK